MIRRHTLSTWFVLILVTLLAQSASAFYSPQLGRWVNRDPIGYIGGYSLYGYVGGMPTYWLDPSGLVGLAWEGPPGFAGRPMPEPRGSAPSRPKPKPNPPTLPMSGSEPPYNPDPWNDDGWSPFDGDKQCSNNCWSYADDDIGNRPKGTKPQPPGPKPKSATCKDVMDSMIKAGLKEIDCDKPCPNGKTKIFLALDTSPDSDYHFLRQDDDGTWSHKPGHGCVTNCDFDGKPIYDPRDADLGRYKTPCGCLCRPVRGGK